MVNHFFFWAEQPARRVHQSKHRSQESQHSMIAHDFSANLGVQVESGNYLINWVNQKLVSLVLEQIKVSSITKKNFNLVSAQQKLKQKSDLPGWLNSFRKILIRSVKDIYDFIFENKVKFSQISENESNDYREQYTMLRLIVLCELFSCAATL
jgi:hypothetical protein